jgi:glutamate N-acetyltransferase/amino-acid N-acetyltransferase
LQAALDQVCIALARDLARDGEGARTLIEVVVQGARTEADARQAARTVCSSPLVKTMVAGRDPNAGRILMAVGRSGAEVDVGRLRVFVGECCAFDGGKATTADYAEQAASLNHEEVRITVDLGLGVQTATAWGCDLTEEYVRINASYTT